MEEISRFFAALVEAHRAMTAVLEGRHLTDYDARERTFDTKAVPASTGAEIVLVDAMDFYRVVTINPRGNYILLSNRANVLTGNAYRLGLDANLRLELPAGSRLFAISATVSAIQTDLTFLNFPTAKR